jgi:L-lactate oxidase
MKNFATIRQCKTIFKKKINYKIYNWVTAAAEDGYTSEINLEALKQIIIKPKLLSKIGYPDCSSNFFKTKIKYPILLAPMGHQTQFHRNGEIETCGGVLKSNLISSFGTQSRMSLDDIRKSNKNAKLTWTIFPFGDLKWIKDQIKNAEKNNALAIILCLDANVRSCRYKDLESFYDARKIGKRTNPISPNPEKSYFYDWSLVKKLSKFTKLPIILKGILTSEDAIRATESGAKGIWISNHGGRMFNSGLSTSHALFEINKKLKNHKILKIVDGGIEKGSDVIKYLCLGADLVAIGRPAIYGLAVNGRLGVSKIFEILKKELRTSMINGGFKNLKSFNQNRLILNKFKNFNGI